jgi:peptide/nickel transport system permease protein
MTASAAPASGAHVQRGAGINRWDSPWLNEKFISGLILILICALMGVVGGLFWDTTMATVASAPVDLPPMWVEEHSITQNSGVPEHPLGTENSGRDMLAVLLVGTPRSLGVGAIAAGVGMFIGVILGFSAGFIGGWTDTIIRLLTDSIITIPTLAVLIVIASLVGYLDISNMGFLLGLFLWPGPTRLLRAQVLSGASTFDIMFKEMMPNLLPYLAASLTGNISGAILAATGLEVLGLGPTRIPTLGMTINYAIRTSAILRDMWWWWGIPILMLVVIFSGLFLITIGLDEIANPRLRGARAQ